MSVDLQQPAQALALHLHLSSVLNWLTSLGAPGLFLLAVIDSSAIPLPLSGSTDLLLLWLVAHGGSPWILGAMSIGGSLVGGYSTWNIGRRGGEAALRRHVPARILGRIVRWVEHHPVLAVFVPALLPPPIPLLPFALASGALGVSRHRFLSVYATARSLRYSFVAWLGAVYGRRNARMLPDALQRWSAPLLSVFAVLLLASVLFAVWKFRQLRRSDMARALALHVEGARGD